MFRRKPPTVLSSQAPRPTPDSAPVAAAREKLAQARRGIDAAQEALLQLPNDLRAAEERLNQAAVAWAALNQAVARHARGEDCPNPDPKKLADAIATHARVEQETEQARQRVAQETQRLNGEIERLTQLVSQLEQEIAKGEFLDLAVAYADAIRPAIPLARALRAAATKLHKNTVQEPLLIDPDADYGGQLFGAAVS